MDEGQNERLEDWLMDGTAGRDKVDPNKVSGKFLDLVWQDPAICGEMVFGRAPFEIDAHSFSPRVQRDHSHARLAQGTLHCG